MIPREPVLNAMRRPATFLGTHVGAVMANVIFTMYAFTFTDNLWLLFLFVPIHGICWLISKSDPFAFRLLGLYLVHAAEALPNRYLWKCSSRDPNGGKGPTHRATGPRGRR